MNWKKVKLGEICQMSSGGTPSRSKSEFYNGNILWAKISDIEDAKNGIICDTEEKISEDGLKGINNRIFDTGTLLLAMYGSVGKTAITGVRMSCNQAILGIRPINQNLVSIEFLKYWFQNQKKALLNRAVGGTLQNISLGIVKNLEILLPDLDTQKHIAKVLDKADALRQQNRQLLAYYDELLQSTFIELFGDPVKNPKGWEVRKCSDVISNIQAGSSYGGEERQMEDNELGVLKVSAVSSGFFKANEYKAVSRLDIKHSLIFPKKGDLLFSRANTRELVAATCVVDKDYNDIFLPDKLWLISLYQNKCNQFYFKFLLSQEQFRQSLTKIATGTSGSMLNISMEKLKQFSIPLPTLSLQQHFAKIVEQIELQKEQAKKALDESEALFEGLLAKYFN